ncbi:MAG TPA: Mut7-C RNAse domain-containing protein [Treponemataceae bacterium]|nr:Mut7-C RNAse domain-containing protein [Treponemataceae bacterium]
MGSNRATFRFYQELNDFLPPGRAGIEFEYRFFGNPAIKDSVEAIGVPHGEVDLILVNGVSVDFSYRLRDGDRASVYPEFEGLDVSSVTHLRAVPLRESRFILDVHLGRLARYLRLLGFDTLYRADYSDRAIIEIALAEGRNICTRDRGLLKARAVTHGYWIRNQDPREQTLEVIRRFDLAGSLAPFTRCVKCNGFLEDVAKADILDRIEDGTRASFDRFRRCRACGSIFWEGSHFARMRDFVRDIQGRGSVVDQLNKKPLTE